MPARLYAEHCAACHGADRLGGQGPALLPENLGRLTGARAASRHRRGPRGDADAGIRRRCSAKPEIDALAAYHLARRSPTMPPWGEREIAREPRRPCRRRRRSTGRCTRPIRSICSWWWRPAITTPPFSTATVSSRWRAFPTRFALHGGPKFTPDGRFVFFMSRDGWVTKYDLWTLHDARRGARRHQFPQHRDLARRQASGGRQLPAAHAGHPVDRRSLGREDLRRRRTGKGKSSRVSAVYQAPPAQFLHRRAQGRAGNLGDRDRPERAAGLFRPRPFP